MKKKRCPRCGRIPEWATFYGREDMTKWGAEFHHPPKCKVRVCFEEMTTAEVMKFLGAKP